jgi:transposase
VEAHAALFEKSRDEPAFRQAAVEIDVLRQQAADGHIVLAYVDEAGFAAVHPNRSAWTPKGERHLIEAKRDKRLNVVAALLSSGGLFTATLWQTMTSELFVGFLGLLNEHVAKPLTVILDNASIHTAKSLHPFVELLARQGLTLYFLPAYSPELNRIENLWHKIKHTWMAAKCRTPQMLQADVSHILDNFGSAYKFKF